MNARSEPNTSANAADQTVAETTAVPEHTALQPADHEAFFAALDTPPAPTDESGRRSYITAKQSSAGKASRNAGIITTVTALITRLRTVQGC